MQSILQGRPNGMPAFGGKLPESEAWKIAAFVRSLSGTGVNAGVWGTAAFPSVYRTDGHPFAFNISIESDFNKLGKIAQGGLKAVTDVIRQTDRPSTRE